MSTMGIFQRATAPFEGLHGEPNTLGGYLLLLSAICAGLFLYTPSPVWRLYLGVTLCLIMPTLLFTLSRGSYIGFTAMYITLILLTKKKKRLLIMILLLAILLFPIILPSRVINRVTSTFSTRTQYSEYTPLKKRITLDQSASARIESWRIIFNKWKSRPFFGYGVTGVGLVDVQFPRVLGETGIVGFSIFIWLLALIFLYNLNTFHNIMLDDWSRGLILGFLAGFVGLIFHSFSANTFIIVRIMEPFWFLAAIVIMLPKLQDAYGNQLSLSSETPNQDYRDSGT